MSVSPGVDRSDVNCPTLAVGVIAVGAGTAGVTATGFGTVGAKLGTVSGAEGTIGAGVIGAGVIGVGRTSDIGASFVSAAGVGLPRVRGSGISFGTIGSLGGAITGAVRALGLTLFRDSSFCKGKVGNNGVGICVDFGEFSDCADGAILAVSTELGGVMFGMPMGTGFGQSDGGIVFGNGRRAGATVGSDGFVCVGVCGCI
jgi:hypothetical protein